MSKQGPNPTWLEYFQGGESILGACRGKVSCPGKQAVFQSRESGSIAFPQGPEEDGAGGGGKQPGKHPWILYEAGLWSVEGVTVTKYIPQDRYI